MIETQISQMCPHLKRIHKGSLGKKVKPTTVMLPPVPVSLSSLCTRDKYLEVELQANRKLAVLSLVRLARVTGGWRKQVLGELPILLLSTLIAFQCRIVIVTPKRWPLPSIMKSV